MKTKHTPTQIENWKEYEEVRLEGKFNMLDPNARAITGMSKKDYFYCVWNYTSLKKQAIAKAEEI